MRGTIVVQTQAEYDEWMATQKSYYAQNNEPAQPAATPGAPAADSAATDSVKAITMK